MAPLPGDPWRASPRGVRSAILVALVGLLLSGFQPLVDGGNSETHAGVPSGKRTAGKLREEGIEFQGSPDGYGGFAPSADAAGVPPDAGRARGSSKASKGSKRKTTSTGSSQGTWSTGPSAASPSGYAPDAFGTGTDGHQPGLRDTVQLGGGHPQMVDVTGLHAIGAPAEVVTGTAGSGYTNPTFSGPNAHAPSVSILPPFLDWKERPLCSPSVSNVDIINTSEQAELLILSLSTDNIQYYPANFRQTSVAPGQKATISIVYLPRTLGMTDGTMIIQTSVGGFLIQMHGQGVPSPYHVEPLLGAKVPAGVSYGYVLHVHNPTDEVLKVKEVYTNEDFLRLSLPRVGGGGAVAGQEVGAIEDGGAGKEPGPARLWEVPPRSTKPIISLEFVSHTPGKYLGLVHIKTSRDSLIMPVDIHAIKGGIYRNPEEIDFGTLTAPTEQRTRSVALLNSSPNPILVSDVYASSPDLNLNINFKKAKGVVLAPGVEREVASVSYVGRTEGRVVAKIFLRTNDTNAVNNRLEIPYKVRVLHGSIAYDQERIAFHAGMPDKNGDFPVQTRQLRLKNLFPVPLVFYSAKVEDPLFQITEFLSGISIPAGFKAPPLTLRFQANGTDLMYTTQLLLSTNVSQLSVPVHVFHGNLEHSLEPNPFALLGSPAPTDLDFGVLGVNEQRVREFNVSNPNPVPVAISRVESSLPEVAVRLEKVVNSEGNPAPLHLDEEPVEDAEGGGKKKKKGKKGSKATSTAGGSWGSAASELGAAGAEHVVTLQPGHRAVFSASLQSPAETAREGKLAVYTRQQDLHVTMRYETLKGSLSVTPSSIRFDPSFPGRLQGKPLFAKSTYSRPLTITSLLSSDPRIVAVLNGAALEPGVKSEIGQLIFDPSRCPPEDNYMADLSVGGASGLTGPGDPSLSKHDLQALRRRELAWETLESRGDTDFAASLVMHTNVIQGYSLAVRASLEKPTVVPEDVLQFPLGAHLTHPPIEPSTRATMIDRPSNTNEFMETARLWGVLREEVKEACEREPVLASFFHCTILFHKSLEQVIGFLLGNKLADQTLLSNHLTELFDEAIMDPSSGISEAITFDIQAVRMRDPACKSFFQCICFFKGFQAIQSYRVAHWLWVNGRTTLALALQSRISDAFGVDIHPAASIGRGILLDHATGVVIGETAVVGDNATILHGVTLGGTGKERGDRHPKIGSGVVLGANVTVLGNIVVGDGCVVAAGSTVVKELPPNSLAVGSPARVVKTLQPAPEAIVSRAKGPRAGAVGGARAGVAVSAASGAIRSKL